MITRFEDLSNEVLVNIFNYVGSQQVYNAFRDFNSRLNHLLSSIKNMQLILDEEEDKEIIASLCAHVGFPQVNTWDEIDFHEFCNLFALVLSRPSPTQLKQIRVEIMSNLIYLSLSTSVFLFVRTTALRCIFK